MDYIPQSLPLAQVAAELSIPVSTARHWIKCAVWETEIRAVGRTRVLYLPPETIEALRARKQASPPLAEPVTCVEPVEVTETGHVTEVTEIGGHTRRRPIGEFAWRLLVFIAFALLVGSGRIIRALLVLHTSERFVAGLLSTERSPQMGRVRA